MQFFIIRGFQTSKDFNFNEDVSILKESLLIKNLLSA